MDLRPPCGDCTSDVRRSAGRVVWPVPYNYFSSCAACLQVGIEEIMMIINHVTEGTISNHVIGGQNVIRFDYTYLGKVGNVANFVSVHSGIPSQ